MIRDSEEKPESSNKSGNRLPARTKPIKILFNVCADEDSYNAQSLNAREVALRLDRSRFESTLFFEHSPDTRLALTGVRSLKLPTRLRTVRILREMLGGYDFIVYIDMSPASYLYLHLPRALRGPTKAVLCMEGTRGNLEGVSPKVVKHAKYILRHADIRTAVSDYVAKDMLEAFGDKPDLTMPVGVDTKVFFPPDDRNHQAPVVLFVGHLIERKGPQLAIEAAKQFPAAQFRLVGIARDAFGRSLISRYQASKPSNLVLLPPVPQNDLARIMRDSDIFLLPSRVEGMPKVTLEAAATGLPCIVFQDYQTPSVVDGVTGFQVASFEEMLSRVQLLIEGASLRKKMGAAAVLHAKRYDWEHVAAQWAELFTQRALGLPEHY